MTARVLQVLASPHLGGAEQVALSLAGELRARGHDITLFSFVPGKVTEAARALGLPVIQATAGSAGRSKAAFRAEVSRALARAVEAVKPDLVHSHVPISNLICHRTLPALRQPWLTTMHGAYTQFGYAPQTVARPYLKPYLLLRHALGDLVTTRSAAKIVTVADDTTRQLVRIGVPRAKIVRIHNGLAPLDAPVPKDVPRRAWGLPANALVLGAMGYFAPVKGFDLLIEAFGRLAPRYPHLYLKIAGGDVLGDRAYRTQLERRIAGTPGRERIELVGVADPRGGFLSGLDLFVVSSRSEGLPLVLIEAMQHGLASVVTSAGGCREAARPEQEALVFRSGEGADLAACLERLILDPALREALGRAAWARAATYLTLPRCADDYAALYASLRAAAPAPR